MGSARDRLVLIGPYDARDRFVGGAPISFRNLVAYVDRSGAPYRVIDTRKFDGSFHTLRNLAWLLVHLVVWAPRARVVMLNGSRRGLIYLGPAVHALCALTRTTFCLRPFGGDFDRICADAPAWHRFILRRTIFHADVLFLETPFLLQRFAGQVPRAVWLPNARPRPERTAHRRAFARRFVFLSQIAVDKGAGDLLDAVDRLDGSYTVDFFGPIADAALGKRLATSGRYRGVVPPESVLDVLRDYDVLVLPTFTPHEGLPGVVVEAFSIGMPVIATRWRALPDLVEHGVSGFLVTPHSVDELVAAMASIDDAALARLSAGALRAFDPFDSERVNRVALDVLLG